MAAQQTSSTPTMMGILASQFIAFVVCVVVPALVTAIAPVCVTDLSRTEGQVEARVSTHLLFVIPYKQQRLSGIQSIDSRFKEGEMSRDLDRNKRVRSEDQAFLRLTDGRDTVEVPVSPVNIDDVKAKAETFLASADSTRLRLYTVANWKFSVFGGGFVSLLTILYLVGVIAKIGQVCFQAFFPFGETSA